MYQYITHPATGQPWVPSDAEQLTFEGQFVRLEPLHEGHVAQLVKAAAHPEIWEYFSFDGTLPGRMERFLHDMMARRQQLGTYMPFAVIDPATGQAIGHTSLYDLNPAYLNCELGYTWYRPDYWSTGLNAEAKYFLLKLAFEDMGMIRVQFKVNATNTRSRKAVEKLGAQFEGLIRNHMIRENGLIRTSAFYSILTEEWPAVKAGLLARLSQQ